VFLCLSNWKKHLSAFPELYMRPSLSKTSGILVGILVLCAIPARGQIVSYLDSSGKRVFINADPASVRRPARAVVSGHGAAYRSSQGTTQAPPAGSAMPDAASQENREKIDRMLREVSARYHVDPALIRAVIDAESKWNSSAVSRKGAQGLMQLVPATAQQMGVNDAFDPKQNLDGGVRYLRMLLERYNGDLDRALAAYNAGPGAVDRAKGVPRYRETREYVQKITDSYYRPGSDRLPYALDARRPIYRAIQTDGRVVFTNE
jgi:soluble lytic murein transglycosylase-like protein